MYSSMIVCLCVCVCVCVCMFLCVCVACVCVCVRVCVCVWTLELEKGNYLLVVSLNHSSTNRREQSKAMHSINDDFKFKEVFKNISFSNVFLKLCFASNDYLTDTVCIKDLDLKSQHNFLKSLMNTINVKNNLWISWVITWKWLDLKIKPI